MGDPETQAKDVMQNARARVHLYPRRREIALHFHDNDPVRRRDLADMHWLAQLAAAIVDPTVLRRQIDACRFRAIETRRWNLVCSTLAGTAIIDPTGCVIHELPPVANVLRTDVL